MQLPPLKPIIRSNYFRLCVKEVSKELQVENFAIEERDSSKNP